MRMFDGFELSADIIEIAKGVTSAETKMRLYEAANALNSVTAENRTLMQKNEQLRKELARRKALEYRDGSYYVVLDDGEEAGPLCNECYQEKGFIYLLEKTSRGARCSVCGKVYAASKWAVNHRGPQAGA